MLIPEHNCALGCGVNFSIVNWYHWNMPGGPRIASTDRERIIESYESGEDFLTIAAALNMKRTTAYSIVRHYIYVYVTPKGSLHVYKLHTWGALKTSGFYYVSSVLFVSVHQTVFYICSTYYIIFSADSVIFCSKVIYLCELFIHTT